MLVEESKNVVTYLCFHLSSVHFLALLRIKVLVRIKLIVFIASLGSYLSRYSSEETFVAFE